MPVKLKEQTLRQGSLDVKYMQGRFDRAKEWVQQFLAKQHRCLQLPLEHAQADLLQYQRGEKGGNGRLGLVV